MNEFRTKLTSNGRVVIPSAYRKQLNLALGDEIVLWIENDELHLTSLKLAYKKAQQVVMSRTKNKSLVDELIKMRRKDTSS